VNEGHSLRTGQPDVPPANARINRTDLPSWSCRFDSAAANTSTERITAIGTTIGRELARLNRAATHTYPGITMPAAMTTAAACNYVWISCPNSSKPQSCWPAFLVRADGITVGRLRRNSPGILLTTVDTGQRLYDSTAAERGQALAGQLHSGTLSSDPHSADRTAF
jgi:deaminated glutathione amidase